MPDLHIRDLVTERIPLFTGAVDKCFAPLCDLAVAQLDQMEKQPDREEICLVRKGVAKPPESIDENERSVVRLVSTAHRDRDNEILMPSGVMLDHFRKNPVVLYGHMYGGLPIGKDLWIKVEKGEGLKAKTQFASMDANPMAEQVFRLIQEGMLNTSSVGFIPLAWETMKDGPEWERICGRLESDWGISREESAKANCIYTRWILLEHSDVAVPSNPNAINLAVSKSIIKPDSPLWKDMSEYVIMDEAQAPEQKTAEEPLADDDVPLVENYQRAIDGADTIQVQFDELKTTIGEIGTLLKAVIAMVKDGQAEAQVAEPEPSVDTDDDPDTLEIADEPEPEPEPDPKSAPTPEPELSREDIVAAVRDGIIAGHAPLKDYVDEQLARATGKVWKR